MTLSARIVFYCTAIYIQSAYTTLNAQPDSFRNIPVLRGEVRGLRPAAGEVYRVEMIKDGR